RSSSAEECREMPRKEEKVKRPRTSKAAQPKAAGRTDRLTIERVQTGVRIERRILKGLKALADYHDITLGDLLEGVVLHAFEGRGASGPEPLPAIEDLKRATRLAPDASASHRLVEAP